VVGNNTHVAIAIIVLVISMPYTTALSLKSIRAHGTDEIDGYIGQTDSLIIEALVDEEIIQDNVVTNFPETNPFDECHDVADGHLCTKVINEQDWSGGMYTYTVSVFSNNIAIDTVEGTIYIDDTPPTINSYELQRSGENVTVDYDIVDTACSACGSTCPGLATIAIAEDNNVKWDMDLELCSEKGTAQFDVTLIDVLDGETNICMIATDRLGQSSKKCEVMAIDAVGPDIYPDSFRIQDEFGYDISHIPSIPVDAFGLVNISDSSLIEVHGDFSAFNHVAPDTYANVLGDCSESGGFYNCRFPIRIDGADGTTTATITAVDDQGNREEFTKAFSIVQDNSRPQIIAVYHTEFGSSNGSLALRSGMNQLTVEFVDTGASYNKKMAFLDLTRFDAGTVQAKSCEKSDGVWKCEFDAIVSKAHGYRSAILVRATNDVGMRMTTDHRITATVDTRPPEIVGLVLEPNCPYFGQGLAVEVRATDDNGMILKVDASGIATLQEPVTGECVDTLCTAYVYDLVTDFAKDNVEFSVIDTAGNKATRFQTVEVCEEEAGVEPNFISIVAGSAPQVDKRLLSFIDARAYVPIIIQKIGSARIVSTEATCNSAKAVHVLNEFNERPALVITIPKQVAEGNSVSMNCSMKVVVRKGRKVYSTPENEEFQVTIPLFNNGLGEIGDTIQNKITGLEDDIDDLEDDIDTWEKYNKWLNMLCSIAETMGRLNAVMQAIKEVLWAVLTVVHIACNAAGPGRDACQGAITGLWNLVCSGFGYINDLVENYVWPTGYSTQFTIGSTVKYGCLIYSCRICDWSTYVSVGASIANTAVNMDKTVETMHSSDDPIFDYTGTETDTTGGKRTFTGPGGTFEGTPTDVRSRTSGKTTVITQSYSLDKSWPAYRDAWQTHSVSATINDEPDSSTWIFDPYRSIHYAKACLCLPGYLYNLRKERQIKCMYKQCLEDHGRVGLPEASCDFAYQERECLYVDSAQFKEHGYLDGWMDGLWDSLIMMLPGVILGIVYTAACGDYKTDSTLYCDAQAAAGPMYSSKNVLCALLSIGASILDIMDFMEGGLDFSQYDAELDGTDYCSGGA